MTRASWRYELDTEEGQLGELTCELDEIRNTLVYKGLTDENADWLVRYLEHCLERLQARVSHL